MVWKCTVFYCNFLSHEVVNCVGITQCRRIPTDLDQRWPLIALDAAMDVKRCQCILKLCCHGWKSVYLCVSLSPEDTWLELFVGTGEEIDGVWHEPKMYLFAEVVLDTEMVVDVDRWLNDFLREVADDPWQLQVQNVSGMREGEFMKLSQMHLCDFVQFQWKGCQSTDALEFASHQVRIPKWPTKCRVLSLKTLSQHCKTGSSGPSGHQVPEGGETLAETVELWLGRTGRAMGLSRPRIHHGWKVHSKSEIVWVFYTL